jgi:hypothetical protein
MTVIQGSAGFKVSGSCGSSSTGRMAAKAGLVGGASLGAYGAGLVYRLAKLMELEERPFYCRLARRS